MFHIFAEIDTNLKPLSDPSNLSKYLAFANIGRNFLQCNIVNFLGSVTSAKSKRQPRPGTCEVALQNIGLATASWGFQFPSCPCRLQWEV